MSIDHLSEGIVHAAVESQAYPRPLPKGKGVCFRGGHVDAGAEGGAAVGRGAYAALDIERGHAASHVGHVDPKDGLALAIVERHIVEGHVDAGVVGTTNTEIGVTNA